MRERVLKVIKPFFVMEPGDTFELSQDGEEYTSVYEESTDMTNDEGVSVGSKYSSNYTITPGYAHELIKEGYLIPASLDKSEKNDTPFVNVFDEIDDMLEEYTNELNEIDTICKEQPACLKVERETVLRNICTVLEHLKSLKK